MGTDNVMIVMAGLPPAPRERPQAASNVVARPTSARLDVASDRPAGGVPEPAPEAAFAPLAARAANLFQAAVAFVGDGCGIVDDATYRQRLEVCHKCDRCSGNRCAACGCWINVKARGRIFRCPIGRWQ